LPQPVEGSAISVIYEKFICVALLVGMIDCVIIVFLFCFIRCQQNILQKQHKPCRSLFCMHWCGYLVTSFYCWSSFNLIICNR
jgi:hypothetical protein